jgi:hypothetical protein
MGKIDHRRKRMGEEGIVLNLLLHAEMSTKSGVPSPKLGSARCVAQSAEINMNEVFFGWGIPREKLKKKQLRATS